MIRTPRTSSISLLALAIALAPALRAQPTAPPVRPAADAAPKPASDSAPVRRHDDGTWPTRTFYLKYATSQNDINEIATAIRQLLPPPDQTFVIASQDAIVMHAPQDDLALVQKLLDDLDIPKKAWRLTYTVTEMDGTNRIGTQHYVMNVVDGQQTTLQQNSRVPIGIGQHGEVMTSYTYENVGVTFDATLNKEGTGARLRSSIELDSIADPSVNPVVMRDSKLKGAHLLTPNKPLVLGSMDIPGSTRHLEIEVLMEPLP